MAKVLQRGPARATLAVGPIARAFWLQFGFGHCSLGREYLSLTPVPIPPCLTPSRYSPFPPRNYEALRRRPRCNLPRSRRSRSPRTSRGCCARASTCESSQKPTFLPHLLMRRPFLQSYPSANWRRAYSTGGWKRGYTSTTWKRQKVEVRLPNVSFILPAC